MKQLNLPLGVILNYIASGRAPCKELKVLQSDQPSYFYILSSSGVLQNKPAVVILSQIIFFLKGEFFIIVWIQLMDEYH